jgi:hypothetical protein
LAAEVGLEPTTYRLTADCTTIVLPRTIYFVILAEFGGFC